MYSCTLRQLYLDPCERSSEATRFSEAMFCIFAKLLKLQVCLFMLHMHRCPKARQGKDHNPKGARARVFTQTCALAPAHGQCPGTRMPTCIHKHVLLTHLGYFLSKKVGSENLIWESVGFIGRSPNR